MVKMDNGGQKSSIIEDGRISCTKLKNECLHPWMMIKLHELHIIWIFYTLYHCFKDFVNVLQSMLMSLDVLCDTISPWNDDFYKGWH